MEKEGQPSHEKPRSDESLVRELQRMVTRGMARIARMSETKIVFNKSPEELRKIGRIVAGEDHFPPEDPQVGTGK